ncbi:MAG: right-handed parallel beta-helix repeat-containing protein [Deltaproteobacteria bacterium]|nr:right-handed parallel beta-helix repeat-containing protein [Deltaproteobacteria bacterium]
MSRRMVRWVTLSVVVLACGREGPRNVPEPGATVSYAVDGRGRIIEHGRLTLAIPAGALPAGATITIREALEAPWGAVGPVFELGPDDVVFAVAPTLSIAYDESELPAGAEAEDLRVAVLEHGSWRHLAGGEHRSDEGAAAAKLEHFSTYGLLPLADETSGVGDHFELNGIVVDTSAEVFARLSVAPTIVTLALGRGDDVPVDVTLVGLPTDTDQYVFLGSYEEFEVVRPADGGTVTVSTTLDAPKVLWVEPGPGTTIISDDPAKDQCGTVGVRVGDTCTLTTDVIGAIEIISADQTLDCDGHSVKQTAPKPSAGVGIVVGSQWANIGGSAPVNVTVRNCTVGGATWDEAFGIGLQGWSVQGLRVENCTFLGDRTGIQVGPGAGATLAGNTITGAFDAGISLVGPANTNDIRDNHVTMASGANVQPSGLQLVGQMYKMPDGTFLPDPVTTTRVTGNVLDGDSTCGVRLSVATGNEIVENDIVGPSSGLRLDGPDAWPNVFRHNNVAALTVGVDSTFGPVEVSWSSMGSYWGHGCPGPLFEPGVDSNRGDVVDSYAYSAADAWIGGGSPGCGVDGDHDGIPDSWDNCPTVANYYQANSDGIGDGDDCDVATPESPTLIYPAPGAVLPGRLDQIRGEAEPRTRISITRCPAGASSPASCLSGGVVVSTAIADGLGAFVAGAGAGFAAGTYTVCGSATDLAGNSSPCSDLLSFTIGAPQARQPVITVPANGQIITAIPLIVKGLAPASSAVTISANGAPVATVTTTSDGTFSGSWSPPDGAYTLAAVALLYDRYTVPGEGTVAVTVRSVTPTNSIPGTRGKIEIVSANATPDPFDPGTETASLSLSVEVQHVNGLAGRSRNHEFRLEAQWVLHDATSGEVLQTLNATQPVASGSAETSVEMVAVDWNGAGDAGELTPDGKPVKYDVQVELVRTYTGAGHGPPCARDEEPDPSDPGAASCLIDTLSAANVGTITPNRPWFPVVPVDATTDVFLLPRVTTNEPPPSACPEAVAALRAAAQEVESDYPEFGSLPLSRRQEILGAVTAAHFAGVHCVPDPLREEVEP